MLHGGNSIHTQTQTRIKDQLYLQFHLHSRNKMNCTENRKPQKVFLILFFSLCFFFLHIKRFFACHIILYLKKQQTKSNEHEIEQQPAKS